MKLAGSPPEADREPGEPDPEPSTLELVRKGYARRLAERTGHHPSWSHANVRRADEVARWLDGEGGSSQLVNRLLDGFFANAKAAAKGFPLAFLATAPTEYLLKHTPSDTDGLVPLGYFMDGGRLKPLVPPEKRVNAREGV